MTCSGMILPDDKTIALRNFIGMLVVMSIFGIAAYAQFHLSITIASVLFFSQSMAVMFTMLYYTYASRYLHNEVLSSFLARAIAILLVLTIVTLAVWVVTGVNTAAASDAALTNRALGDIVAPPVYKPKPTGSMSDPYHGGAIMILSIVMLFLMDSYLGFGYLSLLFTGERYNWEEAYSALHAKLNLTHAHEPKVESHEKETKALLGEHDEDDIELVKANFNEGDKDEK